MGKKKKSKAVKEVKNDLKPVQVVKEPELPPPGETILDCDINPELLARWPKLKLKVPPIFLHTPEKIRLEQHVKKIASLGIKIYPVSTSSNYYKISCVTHNDHKAFMQYCNKKQLPYHTYGSPSKRKMKVVIRGIPIGTDLNKIKQELKSVSIPVIRVHQMQTKEERRDKTMLVLAVVPYDEQGKTILKLKKVMGHDVKLEPPASKPTQCYRCQKWGHSQRYCYGLIKCVKCAGDHLSKKCERDPELEPPTCANCKGDHTANYKNCAYAPGSEGYKVKPQRKCSNPKNAQKPPILTLEYISRFIKNVNLDDKDLL